MPQKDVSAWDVISQQLPLWWSDPQTRDLREGIQAVVPTTPTDLGMMMLGGPTGGLAKKVGAGLIAAGGTGEAEAAGLGNLRKLFALGAEALGRAPTKEEMIELALKSNAWLRSQVGRGQTKAQDMLQTMASVPTQEGALSVASRIQKPTPEQLSKAFDAGFTQVGSRIVPVGEVTARSEKAVTPGMHLAPAGNEHQIRQILSQQVYRDATKGGTYPMKPVAQTVVSKMDNPILLTDEAAEFPDILAQYTGLSDDYKKILSNVEGTPAQKSAAITRLLRDNGVDSALYKNEQELSRVGASPWSHVIFDDSHMELPSNFADGGSVQPHMSLADYFKANVPVPMLEGEGEALRNRFPQTYGALAGLLGTPPDEMAGSVLEPGYAERKAGADKTFALGTLLQMLPMAPATKGMPVGAIIRNTGDNNFLKGSVENALSGLKSALPGLRRGEGIPEGLQRYQPGRLVDAGTGQIFNEADVLSTKSLNKFVEGPLTRYVKNQMATPEDPVRALAEQGVLHYVPNEGLLGGYGPGTAVMMQRERLGFPTEGVATAPLARQWEGLSDRAIRSQKVGDLVADRSLQGSEGFAEKRLADNPWLNKMPPESRVHDWQPGKQASDLNFDHLTDELRNALNPESGLPRNLLLTPEKLQNMGMERAVRHVAAINDWRQAQEVAANAKKANNAATVLHKEYPHTPETPNPKGLRWVELKAPEGANPAYLGSGKYEDPAVNALQDALKYEGDTMKHCVGGYCDDVLSGQKRIFSLRDAKGEPHVTIHTEPGKKYSELSGRELAKQGLITAEQAELLGNGFTSRQFLDVAGPEAYAKMNEIIPGSDRIVQIKRKANLVNSEPYEYRPFVQDFVKSGKWSDVGDIANTGLVHGPSSFSKAAQENLKARGIPFEGYLTAEEFENARGYIPQSLFDAHKFATGGRVSMIHPAAAIQPLVRVPGFDR